MPINYFLSSIVCYFGLLLGIYLIKFAPEEQKPGAKYFVFMKKILLLLMIAFFLFFHKLNIILIFVILFLVSFVLSYKKAVLEKSALVYFFLGIIFFFSSKIENLFIIESVLIFLYGVPTASLDVKLKTKNYLRILSKNLLFFAPIIFLYFLFN